MSLTPRWQWSSAQAPICVMWNRTAPSQSYRSTMPALKPRASPSLALCLFFEGGESPRKSLLRIRDILGANCRIFLFFPMRKKFTAQTTDSNNRKQTSIKLHEYSVKSCVMDEYAMQYKQCTKNLNYFLLKGGVFALCIFPSVNSDKYLSPLAPVTVQRQCYSTLSGEHWLTSTNTYVLW